MISGLRILGSGTSSSTPALRCLLSSKGPCARCDDAVRNPASKNRRNNPSLLVYNKSHSLIVDVGKTFRDSALRCPWPQYPPVKGILLTHFHLDACGGLDDIREFSLEPLPLFCDKRTRESLERLFPHLVKRKQDQHLRYVGQLQVHEVPVPSAVGAGVGCGNGSGEEAPAQTEQETGNLLDMPVLGVDVTFVPLFHGDCTAAGFVFKTQDGRRVAYFSDVGRICPELDKAVIDAVNNVDVLFLDCMGTVIRPGLVIRGHFLLHQAIEAIKLIRPREVFLTGIGHTSDHDELEAEVRRCLEPELKSGQLKTAQCAFDGLEMKFE